MGIQGFSHIGVCVADLDAATAFYTDALGFRQVYSMDFTGDEVSATMGRTGAFTSRMLVRDDVRIELLWWHDGSVQREGPDGELRPMERAGFTHLSFRVDDVDAVAQAAIEAGGLAWPGTRSVLGEGDDVVQLLYLSDPDGNRVEVMSGTPALPGPGGPTPRSG